MASSNFREKGDKMCVPHPKEECGFLCEDCDTPICDECISSLHHGHRIKSLRIVAQDKFNFIQDFDNRTKSEIIPKINDGVQTADDVIQDMKKLIDQGIQDTEEHRRYMKQRIDHLADQTVSQLSKLRKECLESFAKFKTDSDRSIKKLEELIKSNKQVTKSDNNVLINDTAKELKGMKLDLPKFGNLPEFKLALGSRSDADRLLKQAFGCITDITRVPDQQHSAHDQRLKTNVRQLLGDPVLLETLTLSFDPRSLVVTRDGSVWLHKYLSTSLHYMDQRSTLHELEIEGELRDITVNPHTDVLYCLLYNESVNTVERKNGKMTKLFVAEGKNWCLAVNRDGNILVGDNDKPLVTLYTEKGRKVQTFTYKGNIPCHISVCMSTGMVALAYRGSGVLVLDSGLKEIHRYMGPSSSGQSSQPLHTWDAVFDDHGHLIVLEYLRRHVNIITAATGEHMQTITSDKMGYGECLTLNKEGDFIVGTNDPNNIHTFKYVQ